MNRKAQFFIIGVVGIVMIIYTLNEVLAEEQSVDFSDIKSDYRFWAFRSDIDALAKSFEPGAAGNARVTEMKALAEKTRSAQGLGYSDVRLNKSEGSLVEARLELSGAGFQIERDIPQVEWHLVGKGTRVPIDVSAEGVERYDMLIEGDADIPASSDAATAVIVEARTGKIIPSYLKDADPKIEFLFVSRGLMEAGSSKRYYLYFGGDDEWDAPVPVPVDGNTFSTEDVSLTWDAGGTITELMFDDDMNDNPTDDQDRLAGGSLGKDDGVGCGVGAITTTETDVYTDLSLGDCNIRIIKGRKDILIATAEPDFLATAGYGTSYDSGAELWQAFGDPATGVVFGVISDPKPNKADQTITTNVDTAYYYSDNSGSTNSLSMYAASLTSPLVIQIGEAQFSSDYQ